MKFEAASATLLQADKEAVLAADKVGSAEVLVLEPDEGEEAEAGQEAAEASGAEQPSLKRKTHVERGVQVWFLEFCAPMSKRGRSKSERWDMHGSGAVS
eukprot:2516991-Amphidinium_carterae.1